MKPLQMLPIAALVGSIFGTPVLAADEAATETTPVKAEIKEVRVKGQRNAPAAVERVNLGRIQQEMVRDNKDLVRYSTDVGLSDSGRHQKGFAVRGVEGNRVGVSIDGVNLPDSEENSLYARYGNFNSSRLSIDPELVRNIDIVKGADSFNTGSGALGGGVNYQTLQGRDLLLNDRQFGVMMKNGYSSRNREWTNTLGFGLNNDRVDAALLYSQRRGHETESAGERGYPVEGAGSGANIRGSARGIPDPSQHKYHSFLGKIAYQINDNHRIGASLNGQQGHNYTVEESYNLSKDSSWREADDVNRRRNANLFYEWTPDSNWLSLLKADFDYQKTKVAAVNNKGSFPMDYSTWTRNYNQKNLDEIYNRSMDTTFKRITLRMDSQPLQIGGQHRLSFKTFASQREFENLNRDDYYFSGRILRTSSTIQHPVKTNNYGFSLSDQIQWNDVFSSRAGIRYDYTKMTPQQLNAECHACDKTPPAANTYKGWSGFVGLAAQLSQTWRLGYDVTSGFRVPNASEVYFTYNHRSGKWLPNPNLKAERSTTHTLSLQGRSEKGTLDANLYQSNYRNFLSEEQKLTTSGEPGCTEENAYYGICSNPYSEKLEWQMQNIDKARIRGLELTGRLNLGQVVSFVPEGWKLFGSLGYAKSKLSGDNSLLSTQPLKVIAGIDYESPSEKWGVFSRLTYLGAKKAKDAQYTVYEDNGWGTPLQKKVKDYPWLNKSAYVFDMYGFYKPVKNLTLRAGVYNMFNRKYTTWDSLRGLYSYSTTNSVDKDGKGLDRYRAPGRNYAVSLEWKF